MGWLYGRVLSISERPWIGEENPTHRFKIFAALPVFPELELAIVFILQMLSSQCSSRVITGSLIVRMFQIGVIWKKASRSKGGVPGPYSNTPQEIESGSSCARGPGDSIPRKVTKGYETLYKANIKPYCLSFFLVVFGQKPDKIDETIESKSSKVNRTRFEQKGLLILHRSHRTFVMIICPSLPFIQFAYLNYITPK